MKKDLIKEAVYDYTHKILHDHTLNDSGIDAETIASALNLDRANVSRELNSLWKNGELIKLIGRPILFLDYQLVSDEYPACFIPSSIPSEKSLIDYISNISSNQKPKNTVTDSLEDNLSYISSLHKEIKKAIAAISYPPYGLPVLLNGNTGTGKRKIAQNLFYYAVNKKIKNEDSHFITINCADYQNDDELFSYHLLGSGRNYSDYKPLKGYLEESNDGFIYFDHINFLSPRCLSLIGEIINNGYYSKVGESKTHVIKTSFICSAALDNNDETLKRLNELFPVIINISDLDDRPVFEKIETILYYFCLEAKSMNKTILINKSVIYMLAASKYKENEVQLRNEIKSICSLSYMENNPLDNSITISYSYLPDRIASLKVEDYVTKTYLQRVLDIYDKETFIISSDGTSPAYDFYHNFVNNSYMSTMKQFIDLFNIDMNKTVSVNDFIVNTINVLRTCDEEHLNEIRNNLDYEITNIINKNIVSDKYYNSITKNQKVIFGLSLVLKNISSDSYSEDYPADEGNIIHSHEYNTAIDIASDMSKRNYRKPASNTLAFIASYLNMAKNILENSKVSIMLVSHSESIGKQLYEAVYNDALENNITISYLDLRPQLQVNDIIELVKTEVNRLNTGAGVIIMADRQPIDGFEHYLRSECFSKVKVIPDLSLSVLNKVIDECKDYVDIDYMSFNVHNTAKREIEEKKEDFIELLVRNVISRTVLFVNPQKASNLLLISLQQILDTLKMDYSKEIAVKYVTHGVHMIERIIKSNPLSFYHLKQFINTNHGLMQTIYRSLDNVEKTFDIHIPDSELAYLAEIFIDSDLIISDIQ